MANYIKDPRTILIQPIDNSSNHHYFCLYDIPASWGDPQFGAGFYLNNDINFIAANPVFPLCGDPPPPADPDAFKTYPLVCFTDQVINEKYSNIQIMDKSGKVIKTGSVDNTAPIIIFSDPAKSSASPPSALEARPIVIKNKSENTFNYYIAAYALTPAGQGYSNIADIRINSSDPSQLIFKMKELTGNPPKQQVAAFGYIGTGEPSTTDPAYKTIVACDDCCNKGPTVELQFNYDPTAYDGPVYSL